ncbi:hypothetical protein M9Y10_035658 [Tritrichomonas musculus]|uniref:DnaK protein n=1 Tax=Tritrichomonas musculus TaxID=1915356 RepID=A0ABR2GWE3_9EUKA
MIQTGGIDFGNSNCVVAVPKDASVKVVLNNSSNRLTPTMVCYSNDRRYAGELAAQNQMQYPQSTITDLKKLVNLPYYSPERIKISHSLPFQYLVELEDGTVGIKVPYQEKEIILRPEQCIAFLLRELASYPDVKGIESFVITVNPWWSERQRRTMLNAFRIAQIKCSCLLNAPTAAAIAYILQHRQRLPTPDKKSVSVAFVDIGESAMTVAIAEVKQQMVEMKAITYNEKVNGSILTELFEKYLLQIVKRKYKIDPTQSPRAILRFRQAVEKAKKVLSVNPIYQFEVHSLMNVDVSFNVKREEFTDQIKKVVKMLEAPINKALEIAKIQKEDIFELQLLGGTTRVVTIKNELARIFGKDPKQSMDLDECFAIGSGFMAAYLSPKMRVPFVVKDITPNAIIAYWDGNEKGSVVFHNSDIIPSSKIIKIPVKRNLMVNLKNENNQDIANIEIQTGISHEVQVSLRIKLTQSCTVNVADCVFDCQGKTKEAIVHTAYCGEMEEDLLQQYIMAEEKMSEADSKEMLIDEARNDLESQIYVLTDLLNKNFYNFVDPSKVDQVRKEITQIQLWYEEKEFDRMMPNEYTQRANDLKRLTAPVIERMNKYQANVQDILLLKNKAVELLHKVEADVQHQTDPRHDRLMNNIMEFMQKINNDKEEMMHKEIHFDAEQNWKTMDQLIKAYENLSGKKA